MSIRYNLNIILYFCYVKIIMQYSNRHLREVNCSFQFPEETTPWDSTFFGRFYEKNNQIRL